MNEAATETNTPGTSVPGYSTIKEKKGESTWITVNAIFKRLPREEKNYGYYQYINEIN